MKVITQKGQEINVSGEVVYSKNEIIFGNTVLGRYEAGYRAVEVYALLTCHSWNNQPGAFIMPEK